jgi:pyruvate,water dikinase
LEEIHGCPQDIEWAFDQIGDLFLLQSRPITTI